MERSFLVAIDDVRRPRNNTSKQKKPRTTDPAPAAASKLDPSLTLKKPPKSAPTPTPKPSQAAAPKTVLLSPSEKLADAIISGDFLILESCLSMLSTLPEKHDILNGLVQSTRQGRSQPGERNSKKVGVLRFAASLGNTEAVEQLLAAGAVDQFKFVVFDLFFF
jgi:hypothetical protein